MNTTSPLNALSADRIQEMERVSTMLEELAKLAPIPRAREMFEEMRSVTQDAVAALRALSGVAALVARAADTRDVSGLLEAVDLAAFPPPLSNRGALCAVRVSATGLDTLRDLCTQLLARLDAIGADDQAREYEAEGVHGLVEMADRVAALGLYTYAAGVQACVALRRAEACVDRHE